MNDNSNALKAPGQVNVTTNADALLIKQDAKFGDLQNRVKAGNTAPENANHFFQVTGVIGNL